MKRILLSFLLALIVVFLPAQENDPRIPDYPSPARLYNNLSEVYPDFLSADEAQRLEKKLLEFNNSTSNQIFVVIVDTLNGYEPWEFSTKLGREWKVGQAGKNNGIVVLIKPTGGKGFRKAFVAVGKGLEGAIPETRSVHVVDDLLLPKLSNGDRYGGIDDAVTALMQMAKGEYNDPVKTGGKFPWKYIVIAIILVAVIFSFSNRGGGGYSMGRGGRRYYGGSWGWGGGSWGGGGGSWGGGGGGFGGGGGGSFGGGGSGGSW